MVDVSPIIKEVLGYRKVQVFYQRYISLAKQEIATIELISAVKTLSADVESGQELISSRDYVFEPSLGEVTSYMESIMQEIALTQVILESRLAQLASRYNAMSQAEERAGELVGELKLDYYRTKRAESDERIKEVMAAVGKR
jgi:F-type H+-transporting ATPase subunit gamma